MKRREPVPGALTAAHLKRLDALMLAVSTDGTVDGPAFTNLTDYLETQFPDDWKPGVIDLLRFWAKGYGIPAALRKIEQWVEEHILPRPRAEGHG